MTTKAKPHGAVQGGPLSEYRRRFSRSLAAENLSPRTQQTYGEAVELLEAFLASQGMPTDPSAVTGEHINEWIIDLLARCKASTALNRFRGAYRFFSYLEEVGKIDRNPMAKLKPPRVEEMEVPVVSDSDLQKVLAAGAGKGFDERRDMALVRAFIDTGLRVGEMASLKVEPKGDFDRFVDEDAILWVVGKGRR